MIKYKPTNDLLFKKLFTSKDSAHILKVFVRDILGKEFKTLTPRETYHIDNYKKAFRDDPELMHTEVDILAVTEDGQHVTIEMQLQPHDFFMERAFLYLVEAYRDPLGDQKVKDFIKKNNYSALRPTYGINVIDFHLFDRAKPAIRKFTLMDSDANEQLLTHHGDELIILCFFNLKNTNVDCASAAYHWQQFFKTGEVSEDAPEYIKEAKSKIDYYSLNKEELAMMREMNKAKMIQDAVIATAERVAEEKGRERGIEQGMEQGLK